MAEASEVLGHIRRLLRDNVIPPLDGNLAGISELPEIHNDLKAVREILYSFSAGDLSPEIRVRGILPGCLKTLQAHLRHMIWQVQMVEQGDFAQRVQFMGEFSSAFNSMVEKMDSTLRELKQKEEDLRNLAESLKDEINLRNIAVEALQESESRFKYLASHDPLTGALNRRSFMERAEFEFRNCLARSFSCGIVMIDIDHFKNFNDTLGHQAGDEALRQVVSNITTLLRKDDFLGRYGGEEFIFFFSRVDKKTGVAIAERIREAVAGNLIKLESGEVPITASFGVAMASDLEKASEPLLEDLIHNADLALYRAKQAGRNRVFSYSRE
jgi:diguanylate cyclase (GGDEF)-like protein